MKKTSYTLREDYDSMQHEAYAVLWGYRYKCPHEEFINFLENIKNDKEKVVESLCEKLNYEQTKNNVLKVTKVVSDFYDESLESKIEL